MADCRMGNLQLVHSPPPMRGQLGHVVIQQDCMSYRGIMITISKWVLPNAAPRPLANLSNVRSKIERSNVSQAWRT